MEPEEEDLTGFQRSLLEILKSFSYNCGISQKTLEQIQNKLNKNYELDVNMIEDAGIRMIRNLTNLKGNIAVVLKCLEDKITEVNQNREETLFLELSRKLTMCKTSVVSINDNNEFTFTQLCDKDTMVDENHFETNKIAGNNHLSPYTSDLDQTRSPQDLIPGDSSSIHFIQTSLDSIEDISDCIEENVTSIIDENDLQKNSIAMSLKKFGHTIEDQCENTLLPVTENVPTIQTSTLKSLGDLVKSQTFSKCSGTPRRSMCLSLKTEPNLSDNQNTDDEWNDSLKQGSHIKSFGGVLDKLPKKEEDNFDMETIQLNEDQDFIDDMLGELKMEPSQSFVLHDTSVNEKTPLNTIIQECPVIVEEVIRNKECADENITGDIRSDLDVEETASNAERETATTANIEDNIAMEIPSSPVEPSFSECPEGEPVLRDNSDINKDSRAAGIISKKSGRSNDQIDDTDDIYDAPTQKIVTVHTENTENDVEHEHASLKPTQIVEPVNKMKSATSKGTEDIADTVSSRNVKVMSGQDNILLPRSQTDCVTKPLSKVRKILDDPCDEINMESENSETRNSHSALSNDELELGAGNQRPFRKFLEDLRKLEKTSDDIEKTVTPNRDDTADIVKKLSKNLLSDKDDSSGGDTVLNDDPEANQSDTDNNFTEPATLATADAGHDGNQNKNVATPLNDDSGIVDANKVDSGNEMDKNNGLLNEHSYSCASSSDIEDYFKEPFTFENKQHKSNQDDDSAASNELLKVDSESGVKEIHISVDPEPKIGSSYINDEHNYSSPTFLSEEDFENNEIETDCDSDVTDIGRITKEDLWEIPDRQSDTYGTKNNVNTDNSTAMNEIPDSRTENLAFSQESMKSFEFDVTDNFNHLDECISDSSSKRIDDFDDENVSNDEADKSMNKIAVEHNVSNQNSQDECVSDSTCASSKRIDDSDNENVSNEEVDESMKNIAIKHEVSIQISQDGVEVSQENNNGVIGIPESSDTIEDDIIKDLENLLNESSEKTKGGTGHSVPETNEVVKDEKSDINILEDDKQKDSNATIIIENDSDTKESLMDMTMEEFLSDTEKVPGVNDSDETIIVDCEHVKIESDEPDVQVIEGNIDIGDEILSLLKGVQSPKDEEKTEINSDSDDAEEAETILKMLQDNNYDPSDSEEIDESPLSSHDSSVEILETDDQIAIPDDKIARILKKHNMVDCSVSLEKLKLSAGEIENQKRNLEDNWEWLCDLTNLQNKRKNVSPIPPEQPKRRKKRRGGKSCDLIDSASSSSSDIEISGCRSDTPVIPQHLEDKLDDILANTICKALRKDGKTSSESSSDESDDSALRKKNKVEREKNSADIDNEESDSKRVLSKEELKKKAWRNDPLLRGKLSSHSEGDETTNSNSKRRLKKKKSDRTEIDIDSDKLDSDSDSVVYKKNKSKLEKKEISPIKRNIPVSDTSDSDIEFISQKIKTPDDGSSTSQKGRRNIRALLSEDTLAEATKRANKEELERIERLKERDKVIETLSQSLGLTQSEDLVTPLFLDMDQKSGEPTMRVHDKITAKLKRHQQTGIKFMWESCYESTERLKKHDGSGCILAHCMGLGKTFQVLALIHTLFNYEVTNTKHVLVVCPLSTVSNWKKEVKWAFKGIQEIFSVFTIATRKENTNKYEIVKKWRQREKALLVLGYEGFETLTNEAKLDKLGHDMKNKMLESLMDPGPDLVVCDEGHLLRNKNALKSMALNKIRTKRRIVLTGTPLQNNLTEYYHMVQIVKPNLLGNTKEFKTNFVNPITNGQYEDSTEDDIKLMMKRTHVLHRLLAKTVQRIEDIELEQYLPKMVDHAVFIQLTQIQINLYNHFSKLVKRSTENKNTKGFLSDFQIFQYICTHPHLLALMHNQKNKKIKERDLITNEDDPAVCVMGGWWKDKVPSDSDNKIEYGTKMVVMKSIIEECEEIGDKVLVFSQCLAELDLIEHFLKTFGTRKCASWQKKTDYYRMDGTVSPEDRSFICDKFNKPDNPRIRLLLMSTKVGGLGLNLTAANRVIIMTVNWNPSYDTQSVFRVFRFGQQKKVYVYRLISLDTMEEKVYQRGVTKLAIARRVVDKHQITNHYQRLHLQELYTCKPNADNERPTPNVPEDQILAKLVMKLPFIFKYHEHKALLANRPEINLSKEELASAWQAWNDRENEPKLLPPPPRASLLPPPLKPIQTGPDHNNAYNLGRNNINILSNLNRNIPLRPTVEQMKQYFMPGVQANGTVRPKILHYPNPFSNQYIPIENQSNLVAKDLRLPAAVSRQADRRLVPRMWSYIPDRNKNTTPAAPTTNGAPVSNGTIVRSAPSIPKDGVAKNQTMPGLAMAAVINRSSVVTMPHPVISTSVANSNLLLPNRSIPAVSGTWNTRKVDISKPLPNATPASPTQTRIVKVREPLYSSPRPKIRVVPSLVPSKITHNSNGVTRINSALVSTVGSTNVPKKKTVPNPANRVILTKATDTKDKTAPTDKTRAVKRKSQQERADVAKKLRAAAIPFNAKERKGAASKSKGLAVQKAMVGKALPEEASDPASLSDELIMTLGQSGVTIRKVASSQDVITLD